MNNDSLVRLPPLPPPQVGEKRQPQGSALLVVPPTGSLLYTTSPRHLRRRGLVDGSATKRHAPPRGTSRPCGGTLPLFAPHALNRQPPKGDGRFSDGCVNLRACRATFPFAVGKKASHLGGARERLCALPSACCLSSSASAPSGSHGRSARCGSSHHIALRLHKQDYGNRAPLRPAIASALCGRGVSRGAPLSIIVLMQPC